MMFDVSLFCLILMPFLSYATPIFEKRSFADEVVSFQAGSPAATQKENNTASLVLGSPAQKPSLTLGCGGVLVIRFIDNVLIDVAGDDLYVFEVGPNVEAMKVDISHDGHDWLAVGVIAGARSSLDIHAYVQEKQQFNYVRLTDLKTSCHSRTPGADIAAIAAMGSANRDQFSGDVLFAFDQSVLKPKAKAVLSRWLKHFHATGGRLYIDGHSDQYGDATYNQQLSKKRAQAVAQFLRPLLDPHMKLEIRGLGESQPLVFSPVQAKEAKNRRVELIYMSQ